MVRVAGLKQQLSGEVGEIAPDGMSVAEQLNAIALRVHDLVHQQTVGLVNHLLPKLAEQGSMIVKPEQLPMDALASLDERFVSEIFPILTPIAIDPGHPFPHVRNKSLNLGVMFMGDGALEAGFGVVQVPMMLPRLIEVPGVKMSDGTPARHAFVVNSFATGQHNHRIIRQKTVHLFDLVGRALGQNRDAFGRKRPQDRGAVQRAPHRVSWPSVKRMAPIDSGGDAGCDGRANGWLNCEALRVVQRCAQGPEPSTGTETDTHQ